MRKEKELLKVPVNLVDTNPLDTWELGDISDLKVSIEQLGVIDSCAVIGPFENGHYRLLSGKRRTTSLAEVKGKDADLPIHIVGNSDMPENVQKLYIESANLERRDVSLETKNEHRAYVMEILLEMVKNGELKERKMASKAADLLKVSPRYGRYWRAIYMNGIKDLKDMVAETQLDPKPAAKLATYSEDIQEEAVHKIKSGASAQEVLDSLKSGTDLEALESINEDEVSLTDLAALVMQKEPNITISAFSKKADEPMRDGENYSFFDEEEAAMDVAEDIVSAPTIKPSSTPVKQANVSMPRLLSQPEAIPTPILHEGRTEDQDNECDMQTINIVIRWCQSIMKKESPNANEWDAIAACKKVAECFE